MQNSTARVIRICKFRELVEYSTGLALQTRLAEQVFQGDTDTLLLLQHRPVYTLGKRGTLDDFKISQEDVRKLEADVISVPRGGEVTFHGPGQLVLYPIVSLKRLRLGARAYVESLEDTVVGLAARYGIQAEGRQKGRTGVWTGDRKLAAIGVRISQGVSTHGLALNTVNDLSWFEHIVPCGIADRGVTTLQQEAQRTGQAVELGIVEDQLVEAFLGQLQYQKHFSCEPEELL